MLVKERLDDNYIIYQDSDLYHFTSDAVLLSKFATAKKGDVVADFCSGSGIVGMNFYLLNKSLVSEVYLFEMQTPLYELSKKSIEENEFDNFFAYNIKIQDIPKDHYNKLDLVLCNPPYVKMNSGLSKEMPEHIRVCREEVTLTFSEICFMASKTLKVGGRLAFVHRADRLVEILCEMREKSIEPKRIQFVNGSPDTKPYLVLIEGVKGAKSGVTVLPNLTNR